MGVGDDAWVILVVIGSDESRLDRLVLANDEDSMKIEIDSKIPCIIFRVGVFIDRDAENDAESNPAGASRRPARIPDDVYNPRRVYSDLIIFRQHDPDKTLKKISVIFISVYSLTKSLLSSPT